MNNKSSAILSLILAIPGSALLQGCQGILAGIYDEPDVRTVAVSKNQLYIDASDWTQWHYIDLHELNEGNGFNESPDMSSPWKTFSIPIPSVEKSKPAFRQPGIYTYRFDIFGTGFSSSEYIDFTASECQPEPERWTIAVHRHNVRTKGCGVYETPYTSLADIPEEKGWLDSLNYQEDEWNQTDVWTVQDRMLSGIIGNQGIFINRTLSNWLNIAVPPMPPQFSLNNHVFILKLPDDSHAALQLVEYIGADGTKCCLTINYRYPL